MVTICLVLATGAAFGQPKKVSGTTHFLYVSDQRVITLEVIDSQRIILNYINLGQAYELIDATQVVLQDQTGAAWPGHVIGIEPVTDPAERYQVNRLLEPRKFEGLTIWGDFEMEASCTRAFFKTGGRIMELEALADDDFDKVAEMIQSIDLDQQDTKLALRLAGFRRGYGQLFFAGSPEADKLDSLFVEVDPRPPVPIKRPAPELPSAFSALPDPVVVEVRLLVGQAGGMYQFQVVKAPDPALGERAIETVKNSWQFLPAISKGKVTDSELTLRVIFKR